MRTVSAGPSRGGPHAVLLLLLAVLTATACQSGSTRDDHGAGRSAPAEHSGRAEPTVVKPVVLPDLTHSSPAAQKQIAQAYALLTQKPQNRTYPGDAAGAYGNYGMLLMAAEYYQEAETALLDAEALAPGDMRWPYYLAHLYRMRGDAAKSAAAFERAVNDKPDYAPALVWLGNAYLDQGRPEAAEPLFSKALMLAPNMAAALFGRGRAALARRDYPAAIADLEQALAADPGATAVHYPLALAYRGAGQIDKAQAHLQLQASGQVTPPDPVMQEVDSAIESPVAYELRAEHALQAGQWDAAIEALNKGLAIDPAVPALRHKLGTALAMKGDTRGALSAFQETIRRSPDFVKAYYSLALLYEGGGQIDRAADEFSRALNVDPNYVEARLQLAQLLRHTGRAAAAIPHFEKVLQLDPRVAAARYGYAMSLVQLRRYQQARDVLVEGTRLNADHPAFAVALARLLAASPDDTLRDGARALDLLQQVPAETQRTYDWGVAMAMALAETGRFDDAVKMQEQAVEFARSSAPLLQAQLTQTLHLYEQKRPCRQPWSEAEPMEMVDHPV